MWCVCESFKKKRRSESIRLPGSCLNCEYWIIWFMNMLWMLLYHFRAYTMNIRLSGSCICFGYWIFWLVHMLWIFIYYLVRAYTVNFRLFVSCICYEYWIIWIMHRLWILYLRSLQRSCLRLKSAGGLHSIVECAIPDVAKGCVTFFTVKQFRPCGLLDP